MSGNQKKYGVKRLIKEFPNKKLSKRGVEDFQKRLRTTGSIERVPGSGRPRTMHTAENVDAVGTWYRARRINSRHTDPLDRSHESSEYLKQIIGDDFSVLFCCEFTRTKNNNVLTEKCCYLNLRSTVRTQLR